MSYEVWQRIYSIKCPSCNSNNIDANMAVMLTSYPPRYECRCNACLIHFSSTLYDSFASSQELKYGWICPRCNKVNAPYTKSCNCSPSIITAQDDIDADWAKELEKLRVQTKGEIKDGDK